jgi:predicted TIM-barrel fold metal-dependent hydrolase
MTQTTPVIDINAWTGHWHTFPVQGEVDAVRNSLKDIGVDRIFLAPLHAVWGHNPHYCNKDVYAAATAHEDIEPVPVLDPTLATWKEEVVKAVEHGVRLVKVLPAYSQYNLVEQGDFLAALAEAGFILLVQTRLEDPRRQHPLGQVPDTDPAVAVEVARHYPKLKVVIGGAAWSAILNLCDTLLQLDNLYADVSQADGMDTMKVLLEKGMGEKLLFGTHAPLFIPLAGLARVITDISDEQAAAILGGNTVRLLEG